MRGNGLSSLSGILARAESRMWTEFSDAGAFDNTGDIGEARERALARFLSERLPSRYKVARGEVIDASGLQSGQTDILIYDGSSVTPLLTRDDGLVLLPAEALLATVEVKSNLTAEEIRRSVRGLVNLRKLRPYASPWGLARQGGKHADDGLPTFFATVFAYSTTIVAENWRAGEIQRVREECAGLQAPTQWVDRVVVLSRGIVLPSAGRVATFSAEQQVLGLWFYQLMNFLARETARRAPFPWSLYERSLSPEWSHQLPALEDAPRPKKASSSAQRRYLRRRK